MKIQLDNSAANADPDEKGNNNLESDRAQNYEARAVPESLHEKQSTSRRSKASPVAQDAKPAALNDDIPVIHNKKQSRKLAGIKSRSKNATR